MQQSAVFVKELESTLATSLDLSSKLASNETLVSATVGPISPTSSPALSVTIQTPVTGSVVGLVIEGGDDNVSYGLLLTLTTSSGLTLTQPVAVLVKNNLDVPYRTRNPFAFQTLTGEMVAGEASIGRGMFILPPGTDASGALVEWELFDSAGHLLSSGNCFETDLQVDSFAVVVSGTAVIHTPSFTPETLQGERFQLRWSLTVTGRPVEYAFEAIRVLPVATVPTGSMDTVEMVGDNALLSLVTEQPYDNVSIQLARGNTVLTEVVLDAKPVRVSTGWYYSIGVDTSQLTATLDPYAVSWKYWNTASPNQVFRETAKLFIINPSISVAIEDVRMQVSKARTTLLGQPDMLFDVPTIMSWLRRGKDDFNAAGQFWTTFDMTDATGGVREFWLRFSEVAMLRAQALAEGEKAFNFSGQAISLDVDKAQYYQNLADTLQARLDNDIRPYKVSLKYGGTSGGSGNVDRGSNGNRPMLGITVTPVSHLGRMRGLLFPR